jgi:hypothetical protein
MPESQRSPTIYVKLAIAAWQVIKMCGEHGVRQKYAWIHLPPRVVCHTFDQADSALATGLAKSPKAIKTSTVSTLSDLLVDIVLLALSLAFLTFGIAVRSYDQVSLLQHPHVADALLRASKYVHECHQMCLGLYSYIARGRQFSNSLRMRA